METEHLISALDSATREWQDYMQPIEAPQSKSPPRDAERLRILSAARNLVSALEIPEENMLEIAKLV